MKCLAAYELDITEEQADQRVQSLLTLVPQLEPRLSTLPPRLLAQMLYCGSDVLAQRLLALLGVFTVADVGALVAQRPQLLLQEPDAVAADVQRLQELLGVHQVDRLVEQQPLFLDTERVSEVLVEMKRLLGGSDARQLLLSDPGWLTRVERGQKRLGQHPDSDLNEQV